MRRHARGCNDRGVQDMEPPGEAPGTVDDQGGTGVVVVSITVPSAEVADELTEALVGERLAACVKRSGPVLSAYRWQGEIERAEEWCLEAVTVAARFDSLTRRVTELHPYDVPEIIAAAVLHGEPAYLRWVRDETADSP